MYKTIYHVHSAYQNSFFRLKIASNFCKIKIFLTIAMAISALIAILAASYWQTIHAYPSGGGAFTVAKENLGAWAGLVAAAALLIDYVLTVAVSVTAGVRAIVSAFPAFYHHSV